MLELYINNYLIPHADVKKFPVADERIVFEGTGTLMASSYDFEMDNTDKSKYSDRVVGSFFYGMDFYNKTAELYSTLLGTTIWKGTIKNITESEKNNTIVINATNYIRNLADITCVYSNTLNKTGAQIIYEILTQVALIPVDDIFYSSFQNVINIQDANQVYFNVSYTSEDGKSCLDIINEICRITQSHLYLYNNIISLYQWSAWSGGSGFELKAKDIIESSYSHTYDNKLIYNNISVVYESSGSVAYSTVSDATSILKYGKRSFNVPNEKIDSTSSSSFKILLKTSTGAAYCKNLALNRFKEIRKYCEFAVDSGFDFLTLNTQADLTFDTYSLEPVRVIERKIDNNNNTITLKCEFLNIPVRVSRDTESPLPPEINSVFPMADGGIFIKLTKNNESDFNGNNIYFSTNIVEWNYEICNLGESPIAVKNLPISNGYQYVKIYGLNKGSKYYFKATSYDTSLNESDDSNIITCIPRSSIYENKYACQGDIYFGITLDINNSQGGILPSEFSRYDGLNYDAGTYGPSAVYESFLFQSETGYNFFRFVGSADNSWDLQLYYREYVNSSFGLWVLYGSAVGNNIVNLNGMKAVQFRVVFNSSYWGDTDKIYIDMIQEAA